MRVILYFIPLLLLFSNCYKDKGNYDYKEINEVTISGIAEEIRIDQMDILSITAELEGTLYSDTSKFNYVWEVDGETISENKDLSINANFSVGKHDSRFIVVDKELGTKYFKTFVLNVSSATADDGILLLSVFNGKAELSYKRLGKEGAVFNPNFYEALTGEVLGYRPVKLHQNYAPESTTANSGLLVQTDNELRSLDSETLSPIDGPYKILDQQFFTNRGSVYPPPIPSFEVEMAKYLYITNAPFGMSGHSQYLYVIASGKLYSESTVSIPDLGVLLNDTKILIESPLGGRLSPSMFLPSLQPSGGQGHAEPGYKFLYDNDFGVFLRNGINDPNLKEIEELVNHEGYELIYATHTSLKNYPIVILKNGENVKVLILRVPNDQNELESISPSIINTLNVNAQLINSNTKFYVMRNEPYFYFSSGNKVYYHNVRSLESGSNFQPDQEYFSLDRAGYDSSAEITTMTFTRTENEMILGVSRYGNDKEGTGDELKGDVVVVDRRTKSVIAKYEGVGGYPVDVIIKYQNYLREGKQDGSTVSDSPNF